MGGFNLKQPVSRRQFLRGMMAGSMVTLQHHY